LLLISNTYQEMGHQDQVISTSVLYSLLCELLQSIYVITSHCSQNMFRQIDRVPLSKLAFLLHNML